MSEMNDKEKKAHLQAVIDALPDAVKNLARIKSYGPELSVGETLGSYDAVVTIKFQCESYYHVNYRMKTDLSWKVKQDLDLRERSWKQRVRDGKFSYERVAAFVSKVVQDYQALLARRESGASIAERRAAVIQDAFKKDRLFSALGVDVRTETTRNTETGEVNVVIGGDTWHLPARFKYDGQTFNGFLQVYSLSAEQVAAIMTVINLDKLNILDMINLATDSILGPSIRKLTEELEDA